MGTRRRWRSIAAAWVTIVALGMLPKAAGSDEGLDSRELKGTWRAELHHLASSERVWLSFEEGEDGTLRAAGTIPSIDAWSIPLGPVTLDPATRQVRIGEWTLRFDPDRRELTGQLPAAFVPVGEIAAVFSPSDPPAPVSRAIDAPVAKPVWTADLGAPVWAGVTYRDGRVYAGTDSGALVALDARGGTEAWRTETGGAIRARPTVDADRLFVPSDDGHLYRIDTRSGTIAFKRRIAVDGYERAAFDTFASSPAVVGQRLFVGSTDGRFHAVDVETGRIVWTRSFGTAVSSSPGVGDGRVFFGCHDGKVYALDAGTGETAWTLDTGAPVTTSAVVSDGLVVVGSRSYELIALDSATGKPRWRHYVWFSWIDSDPRIVGDTVYVGSSDAQRLFAIDLASGRTRWSFHTGGWAWAGPAVTDDTVYTGAVGTSGYIGRRTGGFYAVARRDGKPSWKFPVVAEEGRRRWGFASSPAIGPERVFVGGLDGKLYAFER
jgi:outer membrane protein assembly factor BamB